MAQNDWCAGSEFSVTIGGVVYPFRTIDIDSNAKEINRSNSKYSPGFLVIKSGQRSLSVELTGPYRPGELPITNGGEYIWLYRPYAAHIGFEFVGLVLNIKHSNDTEDGPNVTFSVKAQSTFNLVLS